MKVTELTTMNFEQCIAIQTYWILYITGSLGVFAFVATAESAMQIPMIRVLLASIFLLFTESNLLAIRETHTQREVLAKLVN